MHTGQDLTWSAARVHDQTCIQILTNWLVMISISNFASGWIRFLTTHASTTVQSRKGIARYSKPWGTGKCCPYRGRDILWFPTAAAAWNPKTSESLISLRRQIDKSIAKGGGLDGHCRVKIHHQKNQKKNLANEAEEAFADRAIFLGETSALFEQKWRNIVLCSNSRLNLFLHSFKKISELCRLPIAHHFWPLS